jgi:hypothetical protein
LTDREDLYVVHKEEVAITYYMCDMYSLTNAKHIHKDKPIFSLERMLHKDYDRKGSVSRKKSLVMSLKGL